MNPLTKKQKDTLFGDPKYTVLANKSDVLLDKEWVDDNIVGFECPQLLTRFGRKKVWMNRKVKDTFLALWQELEDLDLLDDVITINGFYNPRMTRSSLSLSNHSLGTAFDINAAFNGYGKKPAKPNDKGSVHRIVPVALKHGYFWGGNFKNPDGMHFEALESAITP